MELFWILLSILSPVIASSYSEGTSLNKILLANYSRAVNPRLNLSKPVEVNVDLLLNSVIDFDAISGILVFVGAFVISWQDEQIKKNWMESEFAHLSTTQLSVHDVWIPKIHLRNIAGQTSIFHFTSTFDSETTFVTYLQNGTAIVHLVSVLQTSCTTDVLNYPFDSHVCDLTVMSLNVLNQITLKTTTTSVLFDYTFQNSEWSISSTVKHTIVRSFTTIVFVLELSRKPEFLVVNLVFPSMIISAVNGLSFLIPIESGERLSFGVSLLLTFIVFLTTVLEKLPSTDAISYYNMFIFMQLVYGSLTVFGIIKTLEYYYTDKETPVPWYIQRVIRFILKCSCVTKTSPKFTGTENLSLSCPVQKDIKGEPADVVLSTQSDSVAVNEQDNTLKICYNQSLNNISWRDVAIGLDRALNIVTGFISFIILIFFLFVFISLKTT